MEKSVYNMKAEKIQKQVKQGDYVTAAKICDTIDWTQVRSARMLSLVSSVYEHVGKYDTAIDILLMAYEEAPVGRRFLYKLTELALAAGNIREAEEYYKNYINEAADDSSRYILRYKIAKKKNEPIEKRISILSTYKQLDFDERWATELAMLYDEVGDEEKCLALCDEIILWFGAGPYVDRCKKIKAKYAPAPSFVYDETPVPAKQEEPQKATSVPETVAISGMTAESGQQVTALDMSVFRPEDGNTIDEKEDEEAFTNTKRINAKDDFSRTRIFDKLPVNTAELKMFKTVTASDAEEKNDAKKEENIEVEAPEQMKHPKQMEFTWDEEDAGEEKEIKKVVFIGTSSPNEALEKSVEIIKEAHKNLGTPIVGVTKIAAPKLNTKGIISSLEAIGKKDVIILGASRLSDAVLLELKQVSEKIDIEKVFVLADSDKGAAEAEERFANAREPEPEPEIVVEPMDLENDAEENSEDVQETAEPEIEISDFEDEEVAHDFKEPEEEIDLGEVAKDILVADVADEATVEEANEDAHEVTEEPEDEIIEEIPEEEDEEPLEEEEEHVVPRALKAPTAKTHSGAADKKGLSPEAFLEHVLKYCREIDCVLEKGADKELLRYFHELADEDEYLDRQLAEDMVEDAANAAEKHSFGNLFHKRYNENDDLILRAMHFV